MATHSSILAWRIPMDIEAWRATVHRVAKSDTTKRLSINRKAGTQKGFVPGAPQGPALFQPLHL